MNKYELVYIVDAHLPQNGKEDIYKQVTDTVAKSEGKVINSSVWLDKHRMSFPIGKCMEGTYYLFNVEASGGAITKLRQLLKLNEQLLRFLIIRTEEEKVKQEKVKKA